MLLQLHTRFSPHTPVGTLHWDQEAGTITGSTELTTNISQAAKLATMQGYIHPAPSLARVDIDQPFKHADQLDAVLAFAGYYSPALSLITYTLEKPRIDDLIAVIY
jgi:hypothetical protein